MEPLGKESHADLVWSRWIAKSKKRREKREREKRLKLPLPEPLIERESRQLYADFRDTMGALDCTRTMFIAPRTSGMFTGSKRELFGARRGIVGTSTDQKVRG